MFTQKWGCFVNKLTSSPIRRGISIATLMFQRKTAFATKWPKRVRTAPRITRKACRRRHPFSRRVNPGCCTSCFFIREKGVSFRIWESTTHAASLGILALFITSILMCFLDSFLSGEIFDSLLLRYAGKICLGHSILDVARFNLSQTGELSQAERMFRPSKLHITFQPSFDACFMWDAMERKEESPLRVTWL